ncbi:hypothetical protein Pst134EA_017808 [Puccinia striiformis f. sp. tritici]|uniref:hypothetical protein n=1 Tax=Puccinia striiformis f. sp. tritici TaxID=168172 RepID=UPI002007A228|nr:hypothetical protein Pst134EA_017808 [Puccinia striiformis f. sp. tritici]KAH9461505.1 hypothetical protein Pst134EA_017808 [Puccinia striiformis f. sp. tritici]
MSTTPPELRSSTKSYSFSSLTPSDSRSNYPKLQLGKGKGKQLNDRMRIQQETKQTSSNSSKLNTTRPEDIELLSIDDPDQLFQNFTIREIRSIEQRARNHADQKREDLRQMVGERYRDLLSVADSIVRIKNSSENLIIHLHHARSESDRNQLKSKAQLAGKSHSRSIDGSSKLSYILATLVRLLLDLSEHIWRSLEQEDFLTASRYESLGRMITIELSSGNWDESRQTQAREVIEMFPIVERQSLTLSQLAPQISSKSKLFLRKSDAKNRAILDALAAIILLDNTSIKDSLHLLLHTRKTVFNNSHARLNGSWTEIVVNSVKLLLATLENVDEIFLKNELRNLLKAVQQNGTSSSSSDKGVKPLLSLLPNAHQFITHIPPSIIHFSPFIDALSTDQSSEDLLELHQITHAWFTTCQESLVAFISQHLTLVQSTQILVDFRSNLQTLIKSSSSSTDEDLNRFGSLTQSFFSQTILVSLNKKFYELFEFKLIELKKSIISSYNNNLANSRNKKNNRIFDIDLPLLSVESTSSTSSSDHDNPSKFDEYLRVIRNRIQGKLVEEPSSNKDKNKIKISSHGIVSKIENVGKLLVQDFLTWEENLDHDDYDLGIYKQIASKFVASLLDELMGILDTQIQKTNIQKQLKLGDLAFQILTTQDSFMQDLSSIIRGSDQDKDKDKERFILDFVDGLLGIINKSSRDWAARIVVQSVQIYKDCHARFIRNSHYFIVESTIDVENSSHKTIIIKPSEAILNSLNFISQNLVESLGVHRIKIQRQTGLIRSLIDGFVDGILDDQFLAFIGTLVNSESNDQRSAVLLDSVLFDLVFLVDLFFKHVYLRDDDDDTLNNNDDGFQKIKNVLDLVLENEGEEESVVRLKDVQKHVIRFISTINRLWWPLINPIVSSSSSPSEKEDGKGKGKESSQENTTKIIGDQSHHPINVIDILRQIHREPSSSNLNPNLLPTPSTHQTLIDFKKLPKLGGLRCVKPGNRFSLLSIQ